MALVIPIVATTDQKLAINLGGQQCTIFLSQKEGDLYIDLSIGTRAVLQSAICRDRVALVRHDYLKFVGNLAFIDTQGTEDPNSEGLGSRWKLVYLP